MWLAWLLHPPPHTQTYESVRLITLPLLSSIKGRLILIIHTWIYKFIILLNLSKDSSVIEAINIMFFIFSTNGGDK